MEAVPIRNIMGFLPGGRTAGRFARVARV